MHLLTSPVVCFSPLACQDSCTAQPNEHFMVSLNSYPRTCPVQTLHESTWNPWFESWPATYQLCELREAFIFSRPHITQL